MYESLIQRTLVAACYEGKQILQESALALFNDGRTVYNGVWASQAAAHTHTVLC